MPRLQEEAWLILLCSRRNRRRHLLLLCEAVLRRVDADTPAERLEAPAAMEACALAAHPPAVQSIPIPILLMPMLLLPMLLLPMLLLPMLLLRRMRRLRCARRLPDTIAADPPPQ